MMQGARHATGAADEALVRHVRDLMDAHWRPEHGYSVPNPGTYPHLWLWDSCFHAIIWAKLGIRRAVQELDAVLAGQLPNGMVPHMRYGGAGPDTWLGPLAGTSSLTQPPMFGHADPGAVRRRRSAVRDGTLAQARAGWTGSGRTAARRRACIYVVHPWEAGNDHSPALGRLGCARPDQGRLRPPGPHRVEQGAHERGVRSPTTARPPGPPASLPARRPSTPTRPSTWRAGRRRSATRAARCGPPNWRRPWTPALWDDGEQLWSDLAVVGGGPSVRIPISDGVMGGLGHRGRGQGAGRPWTSLTIPPGSARNSAPPTWQGAIRPTTRTCTGAGPAWPPLNYLFQQAARRLGTRAGSRPAGGSHRGRSRRPAAGRSTGIPKTGAAWVPCPKAGRDLLLPCSSNGCDGGAGQAAMARVVGMDGVRIQHGVRVPVRGLRDPHVGVARGNPPELTVVRVHEGVGAAVVRGVQAEVQEVRLRQGNHHSVGRRVA